MKTLIVIITLFLVLYLFIFLIKRNERKNKKLIELYIILLGNWNNTNIKFARGICTKIECLLYLDVNYADRGILLNHFRKQRPSNKQHSKFYDKNRDQMIFWWEYENDEMRKEFIEYLIETLKSKS